MLKEGKATLKCRVCKTELRRKNYKAHLKAVHHKEDSGDLSGLSQNKLTSMLFRVGNRKVLRPTSEEEEPGGGSVSDDGRENFHDLEKHDDADKVDGGDGIDSFADVRHGESVKRTSQWVEEEDEQFKSLEEYSPLDEPGKKKRIKSGDSAFSESLNETVEPIFLLLEFSLVMSVIIWIINLVRVFKYETSVRAGQS